MKEQVFNLFYFVNDGLMEEIGVVAHQIDGTDAQKGALLQSLVETDYKICRVSLCLVEGILQERHCQCP